MEKKYEDSNPWCFGWEGGRVSKKNLSTESHLQLWKLCVDNGQKSLRDDIGGKEGNKKKNAKYTRV